MNRLLSLIIFILLPIACIASPTTKPTVLVSVAPYQKIVERLSGDTVNVKVMVPPGASSHTYEPSPRDVMDASRADLWFQIGESFEAQAGPALKNANPKISFIDLTEGLDLIHGDPNHPFQCSHHGCCDPHIWMSPRLMRKQAAKITEVLSQQYPKNKALFEQNFTQVDKELAQLDRDLTQIFSEMPQKTIMVSHPAYNYLARDYSFTIISLECEGRDPAPQEVTLLINEARNKNIKVLFIQEELNTKGAKLVADILGAKVVVLDPYSPDYFENMRSIATRFAQQDKG